MVSSFLSPPGAAPNLDWPTANDKTEIHLTKAYNFLTYLRDAYGNPIREREHTLITEVEGQGQKLYSTSVLSNLPTGEYDTTFTIPTSEDRSLSRCGTYTLHQYLVQSGGLSGSYYPNKWFSPYASPFL
jgi:hypothetical protein